MLEDFIQINKSDSLLATYIKTAELAGDLLYQFLSNPSKYLNVDLKEEKTPTIRGLPTSEDMKKFKIESNKLIKFADFFTVEIF